MKWLRVLLTGFIVSLFYFPVVFKFFPVSNTKNMLAVVGIICMVITLLRKKELSLPKELVILLLFASAVSIISLFSIVYNQTPDTTYVTYLRSPIIWLSGAYAICFLIYIIHKRIDIPLVVNYLAGACVFQCVVAMGIQFSPSFQIFIDSIVEQGQDLLKDLNRIYGFGANLDVGGSRFAAVLAALAFLMVQDRQSRNNISQIWLVFAFVIITVVGNMIARTTLIGVAVGLVYILLMESIRLLQKKDNTDYKSPLGAWLLILAITVPIAVVLYNVNEQFHDLLRFGFEGFFSLFEEGEFKTDSSEKLESMIVWPEELRTWIIGDGYFENQRNDANYIGDATTEGFYMGTDIGYLRFIFYFGVIGLIAISAVMVYTGVIASKAFPKYAHIFMMGVLCNFIIWLKVSTDLFPFLAIFASATFFTQDLLFLKMRDGEDSEAPPEELESCESSTA